jgi:hypothetical protein
LLLTKGLKAREVALANIRATFDDLRKVLSALRVRDAIVAFNEALPSKIDDFKGESLAKVRGLLDALARS